MQSLSWYCRRLKTMSLSEIVWRVQSKWRDMLDRIRIPMGLYPSPDIDATDDSNGPGFRVSAVSCDTWKKSVNPNVTEIWLKQLVLKADQVLDNKLTYFNLEAKWHGEPFNWNYDHSSNKRAQISFAPAIDYRDFEKNGDCKLVWEPNRCHHLVVLGRAYRATGEIKYAEAIVRQIESWLDQNPFGKGMNWRSPMELSIRLINWVWAIDLIRETGLFSGDFKSRFLQSVFLHLWDVQRKFSRGSSANNHVIGEAAGVFIAAAYFREIRGLDNWLVESAAILENEIIEQTFTDGCNKELALGYHLFVLQFFIFAGIAGERFGKPFSQKYWSVVSKKLQFLGHLTEGGGRLQMYGDCDDGYVLDLGNKPDDPLGLLCIGAIFFGHPDFKEWARGFHESALWLFGDSCWEKYQKIGSAKHDTLDSIAFRDSGIFLLQYGGNEAENKISVFYDCGKLGFKSIAAHGHADALSFTLKAFGHDIFIDPGTYDYFSFPKWRQYFRSTRAHNTLMVDSKEQSVMTGPFMWGSKANCKCIHWEPSKKGGVVVGEHDGYIRLADPVTHRRTLTLDGEHCKLEIIDEISAKDSHEVTLFFHLSEYCDLDNIEQNRCFISLDSQCIVLSIDSQLTLSSLQSCTEPIGGWLSKAYHQKTPCVTIIATGNISSSQKFVSQVTWKN